MRVARDLGHHVERDGLDRRAAIAAVAALVAMSIGLGRIVVDLAAFGGALAATLLVFAIARGTGSWTPTRLLLTGIVLAADFSRETQLAPGG